MKLNANERLRTEVRAEFSEEQKMAIRTKVLPLFSMPLYNWTTTLERTPQKIATANQLVSKLYIILEAIASRGTPAQRHAKFMRALRDNPGSRSIRAPLEKYVTLVIKAIKDALTFKELAPDVREKLTDLLRSPYLPLLKDSWPWIAGELEAEQLALLKKHGLTLIPESKRYSGDLTDAQLVKVLAKFESYVKSLGFEPGPKDWQINSKLEALNWTSKVPGVVYSKGDIVLVAAQGGLAPMMKLKGYYASFERTGIDSGAAPWDSGETVESMVDTAIEKAEEYLERQRVLDTEGVSVTMGGGKAIKVTKERLTEIVKTLQSGRTYDLNPKGFGTAYHYTIKRFDRSQPASKEISDLVGQPVFFTTSDYD